MIIDSSFYGISDTRKTYAKMLVFRKSEVVSSEISECGVPCNINWHPVIA